MPDQTPRPSSASVNPADVDRFNRLGDLWWDAKGKMGILHEINPIRVDYVRDLAVRYLHRDRYSDAAARRARPSPTSAAAAAFWPNHWPNSGPM